MQLYNTLNRRKEAFFPLEPGKVGLYVCGNTVYDECHIGHGRAMVVYDILYRHLLASGYSVNYVRNITDVDDKIIQRALQNNESPLELSTRFINAMHEDERALDVLSPTAEPKATESIDSMIRLIEQLIESGHAYPADNGDVYYAVKQFPGYGKLSGRKLEDLRAGERVAVDQSKRDPLDFVLWKAAKPSEPSWPSPWGDGRPGWHIECSAMSMDLLGNEFDIHGGGMDLEFPHHENEIAQSEAITGGSFARYWVHNGLVRIGGEKMSKSTNNFSTIRDVLKRYTGEEMRYFIIASHYRSPLNYEEVALDAARTSLRRLYTALRGISPVAANSTVDSEAADNHAAVNNESIDTELAGRFSAAMDDDLNTPEAIAVLHDIAGKLNRLKDAARATADGSDSDGPEPARAASDGSVPQDDVATLAATLRQLAARLGLLQSDPETVLQGSVGDETMSADAIEDLIQQRSDARSNKDWARSDEIRDQLAEAGIVLEDAGGRTSWRRD